MMYHKALLFKDEVMADMILKTSSPKLCKQYGRQVKNFDNDMWSKKCERIVINGCYLILSTDSKWQVNITNKLMN